jgi:acetylornithine deacetylase/succinyl-diaminopimelate desuccinylase-like protein
VLCRAVLCPVCFAQVLVVLLLEAASALLAQGFKPQRTLMFAFGHDEELMGLGAGAAIWCTSASTNS